MLEGLKLPKTPETVNLWQAIRAFWGFWEKSSEAKGIFLFFHNAGWFGVDPSTVLIFDLFSYKRKGVDLNSRPLENFQKPFSIIIETSKGMTESV